jgi:hypothetical protein
LPEVYDISKGNEMYEAEAKAMKEFLEKARAIQKDINEINESEIENKAERNLIDYLDKIGHDVVKHREAISSDKYDYKFALERIRTWTCNDGRGYEDPAALLENIDDYINKVLDVVKREPELLPCPNPECGHSLGINQLQLAHYGDDEEMYWTVECPECGLRYPLALTLDEAIRLYNMIANNALPRKEE